MADKKEIKIEKRLVGHNHPPFIIAEMSGNHNQSLDRALQIVEEAAKAGADALKLQTYTADTLTIDVAKDDFKINDLNSLWYGKSLYELYQKAYTPWEWHLPIFEHCREHGLICFSTPFDETAVEFLEALNTPAYKVASFENNHLPLIKKIAETGKPLLISTGLSSISELAKAVQTAREAGSKDLILLKCTSTYPATPENSNILTIPHMSQMFDCQVGLSDHTMGIGAAVAAVAMGATVIEKHFTLSRADGGADAAFSMEPDEMHALASESQIAWKALGKIHYGPTDDEKKSKIFRRSIYIVEDMKAGEILTSDNIRIIRPGFGLQPEFYEEVLGRKVSRDVDRGSPLSWDLIG